MTRNIDGAHVFVSASFPSGERGERFVPYDIDAIADAVTSVVQAVLMAGGRLVTGAHPTISPLILLAAGEIGRHEVVDIYQSEWFERSIIPAETLRLVDHGLGMLHWTDRVPADNWGPSLTLMRETMFSEQQPLAAAIFVGGMEGIFDEYNLLADRWPNVPRLPLIAPGGAARELVPSNDRVAASLGPELASPHYPRLARRLVSVLADGRP